MGPATFCCSATIARAPADIAGSILELERWPEFRGYGPLPGIRCAEFETRTEGVEGTRIRVWNRDGSAHTEEILVWQPGDRVVLRMDEFTPPLHRLASHFVEEWRFTELAEGTNVERCFSLHARNIFGALALRLVAILLERAVSKHLRTMRPDTNRIPGRPDPAGPARR